MDQSTLSHPNIEGPKPSVKISLPNVAAPNPPPQYVNPQKVSQQTLQQLASSDNVNQPLQSTPIPVRYQYKKQVLEAVTTETPIQAASLPVSQYPQVVYIPQPAAVSNAPVVSNKTPLCFKQTCYEIVLKSVIHFWYLVYISAFLFGIYTYRLPAYNENLRLQIELAKIRLREEEIRSNARVREAELNRDLTVDVEKLKLRNEHIRQMESLKISQELAEKYLESNVEVKEKASGYFNRETTTQKKTFLEGSDTAAFTQLFKAYNQWGLNLLTDSVEDLLTEETITHSKDELREEADYINNHMDL